MPYVASELACVVSQEQDLLPHYMIIMVNQVDIIQEPKFPELLFLN